MLQKLRSDETNTVAWDETDLVREETPAKRIKKEAVEVDTSDIDSD